MRVYFLFFITLQLLPSEQNPDERLRSMSLEQKIGQLFMAAAVSDVVSNEEFMRVSPYRMDPEYIGMLIQEYHVGGVIFLGAATKATIKQSIELFQQQSEVPLFIGLDAEWGVGMRVKDGRSFEKNNLLGLRTDEEVELVGKEIGADCKELGVHINFAPVVDTNTNPNNPVIGARSFGDDPELVASKGIVYMRGLQSAGVFACAKHFPGHGDTDVDSHYALPVLRHDQERLCAVELLPFKKMIAAGVDAVMIGHLSVPALDPSGAPASLSEIIIKRVLREQLSFNGLVVTDGLGMQALTDYYAPGDLELRALLAGNDLLLCPVDVPEAGRKIKQAVEQGRLTVAEIDEHVIRVLNAKDKTR